MKDTDNPRKKRLPRQGDASTRSRLLAFLSAYFAEHGRPPSRVEMAEALGCSRSTVNWHIDVLKQNGLIAVARGARGVILTDAGREVLRNEGTP